ncbi:MAG: hypothetical protein RXR52_42070 [Paraburkholderia sp.]|uniref:hypothetical protein n=1 Tax=Burkholderiaceae TaxID=119060 RepID=UPI0010F9B1C7|nr:hypothetical protein [Burkholderia sp. 4M9327F10]
MKSLFTFLTVLAEGTLAYLWLALGYETAGRALIFYLWVCAILFVLVAGLIGHPKFKLPPKSRSPRLVRYFYPTAIAARVLGLAAIGRPVLAGIYLVGVVLVYLILNGAEKPTAESKEGA